MAYMQEPDMIIEGFLNEQLRPKLQSYGDIKKLPQW